MIQGRLFSRDYVLIVCRYFGGLLVSAVQGVTKDRLLVPHYTPAAEPWDH